MFDYARPLAPREVLVTVSDDAAGDERDALAHAMRATATRFGFHLEPEGEPRDYTLRHGIYRHAGPFSEAMATSIGQRLGAELTSASLAFSYADEAEMWSAAPRIEALKARYANRLNFLRPDEIRGGRLCVSVTKLVDNAVCDTVRVKYRANQRSDALPAERLDDSERTFFRAASHLYERYQLFLRAPSDGYFALRVRDGFVVTATKTDKIALDLDRLALVHDYHEESNRLTYSGRFLPSSDAVEAAMLFAAHAEVSAIVHTHASTLFTRNPALSHRVVVAQLPYGEPRLGRALVEQVGRHDDGFVIMQEHGEVFCAKGVSPAELLRDIAARCEAAAQGELPASGS